MRKLLLGALSLALVLGATQSIAVILPTVSFDGSVIDPILDSDGNVIDCLVPNPAGKLKCAEQVSDLFSLFGITATDAGSLLYKENVGGLTEGPAQDLYTTSFTPASDPSGATITWDGGSFISDASYLFVKDGGILPCWWAFDISTWDGMDTLNLSGFWPDKGAISHVEIWGSSSSIVPEPASLVLLGTGLLGLAGYGRKKK